MLWTVLKWLLSRVGLKFYSNTSFTSVTNSIATLPYPAAANLKWIGGGIVHGLPFTAGVIALLYLRGAGANHGIHQVIALVAAHLWAWVGPILIWRYEAITLPKFDQECRKCGIATADYERLRRAIYSHPFSNPLLHVIPIGWISLLLISFFFSAEFVSGFGIKLTRTTNTYEINDWLWVLILAAVVVLGYYQSIGYVLALKTLHLVHLLARAKAQERLYQDESFGFAFVANFSLETAWMLASGSVVVPLVFFAAGSDVAIAYGLIGIFLAGVLGSFCIPLWKIHRRISMQKRDRSKEQGDVVNRLYGDLSPSSSQESLLTYLTQRAIFWDFRAINTWPAGIDKVLKLSPSLIPIAYAVFLGPNKLV